MAEIILTGDALEQLRHLPPESVHTCVTSPPYYNLRDYGAAGQIGNEVSVEEYLQSLVSVFREVRRVLRADGTLWVNMGDSYATRSGSQPPTNTRNSCGHTAKHTPRGYKYKDLIGVPWQLAFALRADGWYLRQDIIWNKSNCMPGECPGSLHQEPRIYFPAFQIGTLLFRRGGNQRTRYINQGKRQDVPRRRCLHRRAGTRQQRPGGAREPREPRKPDGPPEQAGRVDRKHKRLSRRPFCRVS